MKSAVHIIFMQGTNYFAIIEDVKKFVFRLDVKNETVTRLKQLITEVTVIQLQMLGIIGKMLLGPWMSACYTDITKQKAPPIQRTLSRSN